MHLKGLTKKTSLIIDIFVSFRFLTISYFFSCFSLLFDKFLSFLTIFYENDFLILFLWRNSLDFLRLLLLLGWRDCRNFLFDTFEWIFGWKSGFESGSKLSTLHMSIWQVFRDRGRCKWQCTVFKAFLLLFWQNLAIWTATNVWILQIFVN